MEVPIKEEASVLLTFGAEWLGLQNREITAVPSEIFSGVEEESTNFSHCYPSSLPSHPTPGFSPLAPLTFSLRFSPLQKQLQNQTHTNR